MQFLSQWLSKFFEMLHTGLNSFIPNNNITYGLAIILFTAIIRIILLPINFKQIRSTVKMSEIQPEMKKLQEKYKNNPQKMQEEVMKLYKENGVSPLSGCLPLIIQMPILFAMYYLFLNLPNISGVSFLWMKDLGGVASLKDPLSLILPILSGVTTYLSSAMMGMKGDGMQAKQTSIMNIFMSVFITYMSLKFKGALVLYWVTNNLFQIGQTVVMKRNEKKSKQNA
ncbi:membrane protein insertase YidC [Clostridium sp. KNHs214]|uniref:membrane protein insertase YidC n=1 Tax=Clostridium sp. KNHs214 TaxID=1540257 RepID=UPI0005519E7E|nr:membrane protein insertase YidC [Clostridium sp. KNHs214]